MVDRRGQHPLSRDGPCQRELATTVYGVWYPPADERIEDGVDVSGLPQGSGKVLGWLRAAGGWSFA